MRLHRNAKTTPLMRRLIVDRVTHQGWPRPEAAAAGVGVRTVAKLVDEFEFRELAAGLPTVYASRAVACACVARCCRC